MDLRTLADSQLFIVLCYCFSFGPWGILFALDFISPNWRTIRETRISGKTHLFFSTIPLGVAVFYLIVQRAAGDFKEMMASCIAAVVALYHIFRTISGLAQLRAYSIWCAKAVYCLDKLNSADKVRRNPLRNHKDWFYQRMPKFAHTHDSLPCSHSNCPNSSLPTSSSNPAVHSTPSGTSSAPTHPSDSFETAPEHHAPEGAQESTYVPVGRAGMSEQEIAKYIDTRMLVNNQVIDNELFGSELPVRPCLPRCGIVRGLLNALHLQFDDWLCSRDIVRCSLRWTIAVLSNFGRHWVHCNKPESFPATDIDLHLPYQMQMPEKFHHVIRAYQNTLATDVLFYNGGVLDDVDIYLKDNQPEIELSKQRMESLRTLNTKQVLHFLALMAQNGDTSKVPTEPIEESTSIPRSYSMENIAPSSPLSNWSHRVPSHPSSSTDSFAQELNLPGSVSNAPSSPVLHEPHYLVENASIQTTPLQPVSNRKPPLHRIPESMSDPGSLRSSARPPRQINGTSGHR